MCHKQKKSKIKLQASHQAAMLNYLYQHSISMFHVQELYKLK
jgi:hypothetical protein